MIKYTNKQHGVDQRPQRCLLAILAWLLWIWHHDEMLLTAWLSCWRAPHTKPHRRRLAMSAASIGASQRNYRLMLLALLSSQVHQGRPSVDSLGKAFTEIIKCGFCLIVHACVCERESAFIVNHYKWAKPQLILSSQDTVHENKWTGWGRNVERVKLIYVLLVTVYIYIYI